MVEPAQTSEAARRGVACARVGGSVLARWASAAALCFGLASASCARCGTSPEVEGANPPAGKGQGAAPASEDAAVAVARAQAPAGGEAGRPAKPSLLDAGGGGAWVDVDERAGKAPPGAIDGLMALHAPLHDGLRLDEALAPLVATLRAAAGVEAVYALSQDQAARIVVRYGAGANPAAARAGLEAAVDSGVAASLGRWRVAVIERGCRTRAAVSVVAAGNPVADSARLADALLPLLGSLPGISRCELSGTTRKHRDLLAQPPMFARLKVPLAAAAAALDAALAESTSPGRPQTGDDPLAQVQVPTLAQGTAKTPLMDLLIATSGQGDVDRGAFIGQRPALVARAFGGDAIDAGALATAQTGLSASVRGHMRPGDEFFVHSVGVLSRHRLRRGDGEGAAGLDAVRARIAELLREGHAVDALLVEGIDGVPCAIDDHCARGTALTLWLATAGGRENAGATQLLQAEMKAIGWRAISLHERWDTALGWLLDEDATFAALVAGAAPAATSAQAAAIQGRMAFDASRRDLRSGPGPLRAAAGALVSAIDPSAAAAAGIQAPEAALAIELLRGRVTVGRSQGIIVRLGLPEGALAGRHGELPLRGSAGLVPLGDLLRRPDANPTMRRLRRDGRPALYIAFDSAGEETWVSADHGHGDVERVIEPSPGLRVETLILGQRPLSGAASP